MKVQTEEFKSTEFKIETKLSRISYRYSEDKRCRLTISVEQDRYGLSSIIADKEDLEDIINSLTLIYKKIK